MFKDLKKRGLKDFCMLISDGLEYMKESLHSVYNKKIDVQKCLFHKIKSINLHLRTKDKPLLKSDFDSVFVKGEKGYSIEEGIKNLELFINKWGKLYPRIRNKFKKKDYLNYFSYLNYPYQIQRMIATTNWLERLNKTIRKTTHPRNSFPNSDSALNLVCAMVMNKEENNYLRFPITSFTCVKEELINRLTRHN